MGKVVGVVAIKGGVGKTTVASSLATTLANNCKKKVLLIDGNFSAPNVGQHMGVLSPEKTIHDVLAGKARLTSAIYKSQGVDVVPGNIHYCRNINPLKMKDRLNVIKGAYDFVIIDSSPSPNEELLSTINSADLLFMVSTPDYPTLSCSVKAANWARRHGSPIRGIIMNKIRDPKYEISVRDIEAATAVPVIASIPDEGVHEKALYKCIPSVMCGRSKFAKEMKKVASVLTGKRERFGFLKGILPVKEEEVNRELLREEFYSSSFYK